MLDVFRQMLVNVSVAGIFAGVALQFVKEGPVREVVRVAAGLMMTLALLLPLAGLPAAGCSQFGWECDCGLHSGPCVRDGGEVHCCRTDGE